MYSVSEVYSVFTSVVGLVVGDWVSTVFPTLFLIAFCVYVCVCVCVLLLRVGVGVRGELCCQSGHHVQDSDCGQPLCWEVMLLDETMYQ